MSGVPRTVRQSAASAVVLLAAASGILSGFGAAGEGFYTPDGLPPHATVSAGGSSAQPHVPVLLPPPNYGANGAIPLPAAPLHLDPIGPRAAAGIDPLLGYSREPAPMGIADFGVTGIGGGSRAYSYSTSSLEGSATVRSMSVVVGTSPPVTAFELNAVVVFQRGGANYSYWIQNGLHVDSSSRQFSIGGAYVWNFSAPAAVLSASELRGNSSSMLASDTYYFIPSCAARFSGQCSTLTWPATLTGRIALGSSGGIPFVLYQYDLGAGWVTYDNVSFLHMLGSSAVGFLVDGFHATPYASTLFYDAEWVWVGAGGGASSQDLSSDIDLSLAFWNGHNFEAVPNAWNFGGNTGEKAFNVTESTDAGGIAGQPSAHVASGAGTLGVLYNQSTVGSLDVSSPAVPAGTLLVDGRASPLVGAVANFTLTGGTHSVSLEGYANATLAVTVNPGQTTSVNLSGAGLTVVDETGLPAGTEWGLTLDGLTRYSNATTLEFVLPNGSYPVGYLPVPGFYRNLSDPTSLTIPLLSRVTLGWSVFTFGGNITESGLASGATWWVNLSGRLYESHSTSLALQAPNGSTPFEVWSLYEYLASPPAGTLDVSGGVFAALTIQFAYRPTFVAGSVDPADASVTIGGAPVTVTGGAFNTSVIPGVYAVVASAPGYQTWNAEVNATPGNVTFERLALTLLPATSGAPPAGGPVPSPWPWIGAAVAVAGAGAARWLIRKWRRASQ